MVEKYAAIISALSAFISTGVVIWISFFRKTRRDRIDELKLEMQVLLDGRQIILVTERDSFLQSLDSKYKKRKYERLHIVAYTELKMKAKCKSVGPVVEGSRDTVTFRQNLQPFPRSHSLDYK